MLVATCSLGKVRVEHEVVMTHTLWPMGKMCQHVVIMNLSIDDARNSALEMALQDKEEYLMFWDDDVLATDPQALRRLHSAMDQNSTIDILGGVYPRRNEFPEPIVCKGHNEGSWWGWEDGKLHQVYMTGTGFTLFRMEAIKKLQVPRYTIASTGREVGAYFHSELDSTDDFYFAELCNAAGISWYVLGSVVCEQIDLETGFRYSVENARMRVE